MRESFGKYALSLVSDNGPCAMWNSGTNNGMGVYFCFLLLIKYAREKEFWVLCGYLKVGMSISFLIE